VQAVLQKVVVAVHLKLASGVKQDLQKPLIPDLGLLTLRVSLHQVLLNLLKLVFEEKMELVELNVLTSAVVAAQVQNLHPDLLEGLLLGLLLNPLKLARKAKVVVAARWKGTNVVPVSASAEWQHKLSVKKAVATHAVLLRGLHLSLLLNPLKLAREANAELVTEHWLTTNVVAVHDLLLHLGLLLRLGLLLVLVTLLLVPLPVLLDLLVLAVPVVQVVLFVLVGIGNKFFLIEEHIAG
jgi:hypothetical protein